MRRRPRSSKALGLALLVAVLLPAVLLAEEENLDRLKPELKKEVRETYVQIKKDPQFQVLEGRLKGNMRNRTVVDSYLSFLPISPLEMYRIDRWTHRWLMPMPDYIEVYHERWKELHRAQAKRFYGPSAEPREEEDEEEVSGAYEEFLAGGPAKAITVSTNLNLAHNDPAQIPTGFQSEVHIVVNPNNPQQMVAASNTAKFAWTCGPRTIQAIYYSSNGGATWGFTCAPAPIAYGLDCDALGGLVLGSDPSVGWNRNNEVFLNYMAICGVAGVPYTAVVIAKSSNGGATWTPQGIIKNSWPTGDFEDKNFLAIDTNLTSPYKGRMYSCWVRNSDGKIAYSTNNGVNWTEKDLPTLPQGNSDIVCDMAVQRNGTVHVMLETALCDAVECTDSWLYYTRSTDGGNTWSTPTLIADLNFSAFSADSCPDAQSDRCVISMGSIDVDNTWGNCAGTVYATYADKPTTGTANNMDVFVKRSTNGGSTWGSAVRVNDDGAGGKVQFFPFLTVDQIKGHPVLAWMDGRNDPNNKAVDVFTTRSVNCGINYKKNVQVTKPSAEFNNSTISYSDESANNPAHNVNQYGDYIGVDARNARAYIGWTDSRHYFPSFQTDPQKENVGFSIVTFGPAPPQNITLTISSQGITLNWVYTPPSDLAAFNVYLYANNVYTKLATIPVSWTGSSTSRTLSTSARTYTDTAATQSRSYTYVVTATDTAGEEGPYSDPVTIIVTH